MYSFRWVQCQLDHLSSLRRDCDRREALESLPPNLPQTYQRILDRLRAKPKDLETGIRALAWLLYSTKPLKLYHLAMATSIDPKRVFDEEQRFDDDETLFDICKSLIKVNRDSEVIEFSHISVLQFLKAERLPDGEMNPYYLDEMEGHANLMRACFMYLNGPYFPPALSSSARNSVLEQELRAIFKEEFSLYAVCEWPKHAAKVRTESLVSSDICQFLDSGSFVVWRGLYELPVLHRGWEKIMGDEQYTFWSELTCDLKSIRWVPGSALYFSSLFGFELVADKLLRHGANPNEPGGRESYPLTAALSNGHIQSTKLLLGFQANINVKHGLREQTALHRAVDEVRCDVVKFLADERADLTIVNGRGLPPLHLAVKSFSKSNEMKQIINTLAKGATVNVLDIRGQTAMHLAVKHGLFSAAEALLIRHIDVCLRDDQGRTPLHMACRKGDVQMAALLLNHGSDMTATDQMGFTALHEAVRSSNLYLITLLAPETTRRETYSNGLDLNVCYS